MKRDRHYNKIMKYKKTTIDKIIETLRATGDRSLSWEVAGITESTFYEWMGKHSEFSESVLPLAASMKAVVDKLIAHEKEDLECH